MDGEIEKRENNDINIIGDEQSSLVLVIELNPEFNQQ